MKVNIEPTPEIWWAIINGGRVPLRVWRGTTAGGVPIEAHVLSIVPTSAADHDRLAAEIPAFVLASRQQFHIETDPAKIRAKWIADTGAEGPGG